METIQKDITLWAMRTETPETFLEGSHVALPDSGVGDLRALGGEKTAFREAVDAASPGASPAERAADATLFYRLACELRIGDYLVLFHHDNLRLGRVAGTYLYDAAAKGLEHQRPVEWLKELPRAAFSRNALREVTSSPMKLFAVKRFADDFFAAVGIRYTGKGSGPSFTVKPQAVFHPGERNGIAGGASQLAAGGADRTIPAFRRGTVTGMQTGAAGMQSGAAGAVGVTGGTAVPVFSMVSPVPAAGRLSADLARIPSETARFILKTLGQSGARHVRTDFLCGLLRAMGYEAAMSPDASEVTARRDELCPRLVVRAASPGTMAAEAETLRAALKGGEYGLLFLFPDGDGPEDLAAAEAVPDTDNTSSAGSTGSPNIRAVGGKEFAALVARYYGALEEKYRRFVPLTWTVSPGQ